MNPFLIYLWGIADDVSFTLGFLALLTGGVTGFFLLFRIMEGPSMDDEDKAVTISWFKRSLCFFMAFIISSVLTPNSKTIAAMVVIPALIESDAVREDIPQLYDAAIEKLKESLELTPAVEK